MSALGVVNYWGTDIALIGEGFCPGCEHAAPGHYDACSWATPATPPKGYRWATADETESGDAPGAILVSVGPDDSVDVAVPA